MTPRPSTTPFQEETYSQLVGWTDADPGVWDLLNYVGALASMFDLIELYARDTEDGKPGWSIILDIDRARPEGLGYLAQYVGVDLINDLDDEEQRSHIKDTPGFKRGSVVSLINAAKRHLTGTKTVLVRERDSSVDATAGGAYGLTILTYTTETPDPAATLADILTEKPGGIILVYDDVPASNYLLLRTTYATYSALDADFATYGGMRTNTPGT